MLPDLARFHPQVVHFAVALLFLGVGLRTISIIGRPKFVSPAAALLLILGVVSTWVAVESGVDAHGPVEAIPGLREIVQHHEGHAMDVRRLFLVVVALEVVALIFVARDSLAKYARFVHAGSALVGLFGLTLLYETSELGGQIVYSYAGGPGLRSGDTTDVERLLISGLYSQGNADRRAGRSADAARLFDELATRFPQDTTVKLLHAESMLRDRKDFARALAAARSVGIDQANGRLVRRRASLVADAFVGLGMRDSARAVLQQAAAAFPNDARIKAKLDSLAR